MSRLRRATVLVGMAEVARRYVRKNPDKVNRAADQVGSFVDKRTKGKYHDQISVAVNKVRGVVGRLGA